MCVGRPAAAAHRWAGVVGALCLAALPGCRSRSAQQAQPVAEFTADVDTGAGTVTLRMKDAAGTAQLASLQPIEPGSVALVPEWTGAVAPDGTVTGHDCGVRGTVCTGVTVRSSHAAELHDVYVELIELAPALGHLGLGTTAAPSGSQAGAGEVSARYGLWRYPALLDLARGAAAGPTLGANAATRTWIFDARTAQHYRFTGRVMATVVTPAATGLQATCAGVATDLGTTSDCGECGRTAADASACAYATTQGTLANGTSGLDFQVTCPAGRSACDSDDANAFVCRDLQNDAQNCGACGHGCGGLPCTAGVCGARCAAGESVCTVGGSARCCPAGSTCSAGACVLTDATEVAVGRDHACAATLSTRPAPPSTGSPAPTTRNNVVCWGAGFFGAYTSSRGVVMPEYLPVGVGGGYQLREDTSSVSCGDTSCVAVTTGFIDGINGTHYGARQWGPTGNFINGWGTQATQISWGGAHGCGNYGWGVYCWGSNLRGQIGNGNLTLASCPEQDQRCMVSDLTGAPWNGTNGAGLTAKQVVAGGDATCAVLQAPGLPPGTAKGAGQTENGVACWGDNTYGQLGLPLATAFTPLPHLVAGVANARAVSVGRRHAVAVVNGGAQLVFWGRNAEGEFGDGTNASTPGTPVTVTPAGTVTSVSAGQDFTCYVSGGRVYCAGANDRGQLGDGTTQARNTFAQVPGVYGATAVSAGGVPGAPNAPLGSACALAGGQVVCWGDNSSGQLGIGSTDLSSPLPRNVVLEPNLPVP